VCVCVCVYISHTLTACHMSGDLRSSIEVLSARNSTFPVWGWTPSPNRLSRASRSSGCWIWGTTTWDSCSRARWPPHLPCRKSTSQVSGYWHSPFREAEGHTAAQDIFPPYRILNFIIALLEALMLLYNMAEGYRRFEGIGCLYFRIAEVVFI
jgi:hypothetical protein